MVVFSLRLSKLVGKLGSFICLLQVIKQIDKVSRITLLLLELCAHTKLKRRSVYLIKTDGQLIFFSDQFMNLLGRNPTLDIQVDLTHNLSILVNALASRHIILVELERMRMMHDHSTHPLVHLLLRVVPESHIYRAVILDITLVEVDTLLNILALVVLLASTDQMKAVHRSLAFTELLVAHFELHFVPQTVLIVCSQRIVRVSELRWERCQVDEVRVLTLDSLFIRIVKVGLLVHIVELAIYLLLYGVIDLDILLGKLFLIMVVNVVHHVLVHLHHLLVEVTLHRWELRHIHLPIRCFLSQLFWCFEAPLDQVSSGHQLLDDGIALLWRRRALSLVNLDIIFRVLYLNKIVCSCLSSSGSGRLCGVIISHCL